jgi:hypothetical protein
MLCRNYSAAFLGLFFMVSILFLQTQPLEASSKSPYESGFDDGCEDVQMDDPEDRYINDPGEEESHHTSEFNRGYDSGFETCQGNAPLGQSSCYTEGIEDGRNDPFDQEVYDHCGDTNQEDNYYNGFIDGCMSVEGNTQDVCEGATDA